VRQVNEDRVWCGELPGGWTAVIVADGMGGHRAGEVASELAVGCLEDALQFWDPAISADDGVQMLQDLIRKANQVVFETASLNEQYHNMGTTVIVAIVSSKGGWIGHVGDSRVYRLRQGSLTQLTDDHTVINELAKAGQLTPEEAARHPLRHAITRSVGTDREVKPEVAVIDWQAGDRMLLCSDGLSNMVEHKLLEMTLNQPGVCIEIAADRLLEMALDAGGEDNVTIVLVEDDIAVASEGESS